MAREKRPKPFYPPPPEYDAGSPESSLCYALIDEAIVAGWDFYPEHPRGRFDILLVAREGCSTALAEPGVQIGVQAKMKLNEELLQQLSRAINKEHRWNGPDRLVALVPEMPRTKKEKEIESRLFALGVGIFAAYVTFQGNDSTETRRAVNLDTLARAGAGMPFPGRLALPKEVPEGIQPGMSSPLVWSDWQQRTMRLIVRAARQEITVADVEELGVRGFKFMTNGRIPWFKHVGKVGRRFTYVLNPEVARDRLDIKFPDMFRKYKEEDARQHEKEADPQAAVAQEKAASG